MQALPKNVVILDRRNPCLTAHRRFVDLIKSSRADAEYPSSLYEVRRAVFIRQINHQVTRPAK